MNLVTVGTGESLIDITSYIASDDDCMHRIYRAQKNKLKMLYDFRNTMMDMQRIMVQILKR